MSLRSRLLPSATVLLATLLTFAPPCFAGWIPQGNPVAAGPKGQYRPQIVPDAAGGAIITWLVVTSPGYLETHAQRITAQGDPAPGWPATGHLVFAADDVNSGFSVTTQDGQGGAFVAWTVWPG